MKILSLLVFILSLVSYFFAPIEFNYPFIVWEFALFIFAAYLSIKKDMSDKFFFSFSILYMLSFFLVIFAYPMFIHGSLLEILFMDVVDGRYIVRGTALCQLAFSSYVLGTLLFQVNLSSSVEHLRKKTLKINYFTIPIIGFVILVIGMFFMKDDLEESINFDIGWSATLFLLTIVYTIITTHFLGKDAIDFKRYFLYLIIGVSGFLLIFITQDRGLFINVILVFLSVYTFYIKRLSFYKTLSLLALGVLTLSLLANFREKAGGIMGNINDIGNVESAASKWEYFNDLTSISRNVYEGYEYKDKYGYFHPERGLVILISPIPFLPSILNQLLFSKNEDTATSSVLSKYTISKTGLDDDGGLGTNHVIDLYMSWGVAGVILMNIFLGFITTRARDRMHDNIYYAVIYFVITAFAIYIPRSTIFDPYRLIVWMLILTFIMQTKTFRTPELNED